MIDQFRTVYRGGTGEIVEKKSRFIATVRLVESEEDILVLFRRIFRFSFCTSHEIQHFCASDVVVATLVAM